MPHLLDWDGDGHTDLVIAYASGTRIYIANGPLAGKSNIEMKTFDLPGFRDRKPQAFAFADWDGDGRIDLVTLVQYQETTAGAWRWGIFWSRNTVAAGEPAFTAPVNLLTLPAPWEIEAFAVTPRDKSGRPGLALSVGRKTEAVERSDKRLWLYWQDSDPSDSPSDSTEK